MKAIIVDDRIYKLLDEANLISSDGNIEYKTDWFAAGPLLVGFMIGVLVTIGVVIRGGFICL